MKLQRQYHCPPLGQFIILNAAIFSAALNLSPHKYKRLLSVGRKSTNRAPYFCFRMAATCIYRSHPSQKASSRKTSCSPFRITVHFSSSPSASKSHSRSSSSPAISSSCSADFSPIVRKADHRFCVARTCSLKGLPSGSFCSTSSAVGNWTSATSFEQREHSDSIRSLLCPTTPS